MVMRLIKKLLTPGGMSEIYWDRNSGQHRQPFVHWESPQPIQDQLNLLVSGSTEIQPPRWFVETYGPFANIADVGAGDGVLTYCLGSWYPSLSVTAYDLSLSSLEVAKKRCADLKNCRFERIDLNRQALPASLFDAIMTTGAMHHIKNLDFCFAGLARSLKPGGFLWLNDYVGPPRFRASDTHIRLANELLRAVPQKWRQRDAVVRTKALRIRVLDPSEAVASDAIEDALFAHFEVIRKFERGGTLMSLIVGCKCLAPEMIETQEGLECLRQLYLDEREMIAAGALKSLNNMYIGKPRPTGGPQHSPSV